MTTEGILFCLISNRTKILTLKAQDKFNSIKASLKFVWVKISQGQSKNSSRSSRTNSNSGTSSTQDSNDLSKFVAKKISRTKSNSAVEAWVEKFQIMEELDFTYLYTYGLFPNLLNHLHTPTEIPLKIFGYLTPRNREIARAVSRIWKIFLSQNPTVMNNETHQSICKLKAQFHVKVQGLTIELQDAIKFSQTLRRLDFWDIVVSYNLLRLLSECSSVKELNFGSVTLDSDKRMECPTGLTLPEVRAIGFVTKGNVHLTAHELILINILRQIQFRTLELVTIIAPSYAEQYTNQAQTNLMLELKSPFRTELPYGIKSTELLGFLIGNRQTLKKFLARDDELRPFGSPIEEFIEEIGQLQLEVMKCDIRKAGEFTGNEALVIQGQRSLKKLDVHLPYNSWPTVARAIESNAASLTEVTLNIDSWLELDQADFNEPFSDFPAPEATVFNNCVNLKNLYTMGRTIRNWTSLPPSITSLTVVSAEMGQADLLAIGTRLQNLIWGALYLYSRPSEGIEGIAFVSVEIILAFIQLENLKNLIVHHCRADQNDVTALSNSQERFAIHFTSRDFDLQNHGEGFLTISKKFAATATAAPQ